MKWHLVILIFWMTFFHVLIQHFMSSLIKHLFTPCFLLFLDCLSFCPQVIAVLYFQTLGPYYVYEWQIFLPFCGSHFHFIDTVFWCTQVINLDELKCIFSFVVCDFGVKFNYLLPNSRIWNFTAMFSSKSFIVLAFVFMSLTHFELIFVDGVRSVKLHSFVYGLSSCSRTICW